MIAQTAKLHGSTRLYVPERALRVKPYRTQVASECPGARLVG